MTKKTECEDQGERVQHRGKAITDVRDIGNEKALDNESVVAQMRMPRWMYGVTKLDRTRNGRIVGKRKWGQSQRKCMKGG